MFPWVYYSTAIGLLLLLIRLCQTAESNVGGKNRLQSDVVFVSLVLLTLTFMRLPSLLDNSELNPDEGQLVTQAITLIQDPVFGRSVDGTSIGPINSYLLLLPHWLGFPIDYTDAHLTSLLLIAIALVVFYKSLLQLVTPMVSRLSLLIALVFFAWTTENHFLHYSSELSSLPIITACFYGATRILQSTKVTASTATYWVLGFLAGLTPYCKLQTLPIVGAILAVATLYVVRSARQQAFRPVAILSVAFLLPTLIVFGFAYWTGVEQYFIDYYFVGNLTTYSQLYADSPLIHRSFLRRLIDFPLFSIHHPDFAIFILFNSFILLTAAFLVRWTLRKRQNLPTTPFWTNLLVILTTLSALWAVITPGTEFGHHLLLLVFPFGWVMALSLQFLRNNLPAPYQARLASLILVLFIVNISLSNHVLLVYLKQVLRPATNNPVALAGRPDPTSLQMRNPAVFWFPDKARVTLSPVAEVVKRYTTDDDKMAVWGWNCQYYVETHLAQGVSENHTQRSIIPNQLRDRYLSRYAQELQKNKPAVFIDAVGPASQILNKPNQQHEQFALINQVIQNQYSLVASVDSVRIYIRRDRLPSQRLSRVDKRSPTL